MTENNNSYQDKRQFKEQEREAMGKSMRRKNTTKKYLTYGFWLLVIIGVVWGLYLYAGYSEPKGEDLSRAVELMEVAHITPGSPLPKYTSNPPSSGPHYEQTAQSGFREEEIPDQNIIHNLEHGDIWIAYHPRISEEAKNALKKFGAAKVIITPRSANETDIALVSWGRVDTFNLEANVIPEQRINDFIKRYILQGPERVPGASGGI